jgi:hypothetical protein
MDAGYGLQSSTRVHDAQSNAKISFWSVVMHGFRTNVQALHSNQTWRADNITNSQIACQGCLPSWVWLTFATSRVGGMGASSSCMQVAPDHVDPAFRRLRPIGARSRRGCRIRRRAQPVWRCLQKLRLNVVRKLWPHAAGEHSSHHPSPLIFPSFLPSFSFISTVIKNGQRKWDRKSTILASAPASPK